MACFEAQWANGTKIRWKSLTRDKWLSISSSSPFDIDISVYKYCVISGPDLNRVGAGIVKWLADREYRNSPFSGDLKLVQNNLLVARQELASNYFSAASALMVHALKMSFDEIDKLDSVTFFRRLAQAEFLTGRPLDPAPADNKPTSRRPRGLGDKPVKEKPTIEKENFRYTK